jgi:hypothetical protein
VIKNYRVQRFIDESGIPALGKPFGLCDECLPLVKTKPNEVIVPAKDDEVRPCHRCKKTNAPSSVGTFYNTIGITGATLAERIAHAETQDLKVLLWFEAHPSDGFIRDEIHRLVLPTAQITSAGRALNTLMEAGRLVKTDEFREGEFGTRQHVWRLARAQV